MTATSPKLTLPQLKRFARSRLFRDAVADTLMAQAYAEITRERVDAYIKPVFDQFTFTVGEKFSRCGVAGERITDPELLYLSGDEELCSRYFAACDVEHRRHGFTGPEGHCPALIAEHDHTKAEWALLKLACPVIGIPDWESVHGQHREKLLELLLGLAFAKDLEPAPI